MAADIHPFPNRRPKPLEIQYPSRWADRDPPPIEWIVDGLVPRRSVVLFSGDSGLGKSLAMQQLMVASSMGKSWLGFGVQQVRSFGLFCEDPQTVLEARQISICRHYDIERADVEDMSLVSRIGEDNSLMDFDRKTDAGRVTPLYDQIVAHCKDFGVQLLVLDTRAQVFNGMEIARKQVTTFVSKLQKIADGINGAVILSDHPSNQGLADGRGSSGSTAWRASVRCHLYLKRPKGYDEDDENARDERVLKTMKSNWGPALQAIKLKWEDGVFVREGAPVTQGGLLWQLEKEDSVERALRYLIGNGQTILCDNSSARGFVPVMRQMPAFKDVAPSALLRLYDDMVGKGRLMRVQVGPASKVRLCVRPRDVRYLGEAESEDPEPPSTATTT